MTTTRHAYRMCHSKGSKYSIVMETHWFSAGLVGCTPLVVGLHPCSLCGLCPDIYAMPPGHTSCGSGGGSLPQPSPSQCPAFDLRCVLLLPTAGHPLRPGPFCVPLDDGPMSSLFV